MSPTNNFWLKLPKPFFILAPMADVTDSVFRHLVAEKGKPDVMFTEFVAADGLMHPLGREHLLIDLKYSELERPIVAQIWGGKPENIEGAAALVRELGFDGVDINMGCPDRGVEKQRGGASHIRNYEHAKEIIAAAMKGARSTSSGQAGIPVSVKTRIGYKSFDPDWIKLLVDSGIAALTLHLRTREEMSKVPAHWELAEDLRKLVPGLLIGNGDVEGMADAKAKAEGSGFEGVMLGRAIFGNPWLFTGKPKPEWREGFGTITHHAQMFEQEYTGKKSFAIMKKFFGAYVSGHPQAHEIKLALMNCSSAVEVEKVLAPFM